jgi:hypothetical protein
LERPGEILYITAPGYSENDASAEGLAAARHLLEITCRLPILIRATSSGGSVFEPSH